jgi:ADP-ribose pyrophosphatase YjhB (NUDIX family)
VAPVVHSSLIELEEAIRSSWCLWTSDPVDQPGWSESNAASGQCGSTALVVQDFLGGQLLLADVQDADGAPAGVHYWNRLSGGLEVDLTREQFRAGETIGEPRVIERPEDVTRGRLPGQYHLLVARVSRRLAGAPDADRPRPVTIKGVCVDADGRVLLCRNHAGDWELPGGRPEVGELFQDCLARELREETGLDIAVDRLLGVVALEALPGKWIDVVGYRCFPPDSPAALTTSEEHESVAFVELASIGIDELPLAYRELIGRR